jgi:DNA-binding SARP family transcriptional activator
VRIGLLGPFVLEIGRVAVDDLPRKERALVQALALVGGRPLPRHELAAAVWEGEPPESARKGLQVLAHRLRKRIGEDLLVTEDDGYRLAVPGDAVDAVRFERLLDEARGTDDPRVALSLVEAALALWRGEPVADLGDGDLGRSERARLVGLRLVAEEDRFDLALALGRHLEVVADLEASLADERLRERRWRQLMVALYRSGRQADALRADQRARRALVDALGVEPGPELKALEAAVIRHDPELELSPSGATGWRRW